MHKDMAHLDAQHSIHSACSTIENALHFVKMHTFYTFELSELWIYVNLIDCFVQM